MKLLFVLVFGILLVLVGCSQVEKPDSLTSETKIPTVVTRTPEPIPVPNTSLSELQKEIDEHEIVTEFLTLLNNSGNDYIRFLQATTDIYQLQGLMIAPEENQYHVSYVATKLTLFGLMVYGDAIRNWNPPEESAYYNALLELKEAELYRIEYFGGLTEMMLTTLPTEDIEAIQININVRVLEDRNYQQLGDEK